MKPAVVSLLLLGLMGVKAYAQEQAATPVSSTAVVMEPAAGWGPCLPWCRSLNGHASADEACCRDRSLHCPIEVYFRNGASLVIGDGALEDAMKTGWASQVGAKNFWAAANPNAAWIGELGVDYVYNDSNGSPVRNFGNRSLRELHRVYGHLALGYEYQYTNWLFGADFGGRMGHAHAKFNDVNALRVTDIPYGVFAGLNAGVLVSCRCFDLVLGGRFEWNHDWLDVDLGDDDISEVKLLFSVALRY